MNRTRSGFTIVELFVVVSVVAILAVITIVGYGAWRQNTINSQLKSDLQGAATAMESARNFGSGYPSVIPTTFTASEGTVLVIDWVNDNDFCIQASSPSTDATFYIRNTGGTVEGSCPSEPLT